MPSKNLGQVAALVVSASQPNNQYVVWFDLSSNTLKYYNFNTLLWEALSPGAVLGQIKLDAGDTLGYLIDKIDSSLTVSGGQLKVTEPVTPAEKAKWNGQTTTYFVSNVSDLGSLTPNTGDRAVVADDGDGKRAGYYWTGAVWNKDFDPDWENVNLLWANIVDVPLASNAEVQAGVSATKLVTPAGLESKTATETRKGIIEIATLSEVKSGIDTEKAITPYTLSNFTGFIAKAYILIGDWNMDSTESIDVFIPLDPVTTFNKIIKYTAIIFNDDGNESYSLETTPLSVGAEHAAGCIYLYSIGQYYARLRRRVGGIFDSVDFNSTSYNRGYLVIDFIY